MIHELRIHGLGVIEDAVVPFGRGLTVLTGETGAGKTMVVTGLGLLMGGKADPTVVRSGASRADIDGEWLLDPDDAEVMAALDDAGARLEDQVGGVALTLGRTVAAEGRSRAFVGGRSVPSVTLAEITERLLTLHGQSDQVLLRDPRRQRDLLDRYAGADHQSVLEDYRTAYRSWRSVQRERAEVLAHRQDREREAELLRMGIAEIAGVAPEPGEDERLKTQAAILAHATDLVAEATIGHDALVGGGDDAGGDAALDRLALARRAVERAAALDPTLAGMLSRLDELSSTVADVAAELSEYVGRIEADPQQLAQLEERRQRLSGLKRKYGPGLDDVLAWWRSAEDTVEAVDGAEDRLADLAGQEQELESLAAALAATVTSARQSAAAELSGLVTAELQALAMADAEFVVGVDSRPDDLTPEGADTVAMLLRPHAGSELRPIGKGASGGELSRIMLAIEVVLAGSEQMPTFVFDEVDAGIGGKVAVEVGRRLARLARSAQVIVVTHLPQVAAFADRHVVVAKGGDGHVTSASVVIVEGEARVQELVRMLSGLEGSVSGAQHAAELLDLAARESR